jgi:hypothetical protein
MYACIFESGYGFFEGACTPRNATAHSCDPPPSRNTKTGAPLLGLRPEVDHTPCYRQRRFSLG